MSTKTDITSLAWWTAAGQRAAYTGLAVAVPLAMGLVAGTVDYIFVLSAVAMALVASLVTSLAGVPELGDEPVAAWKAVLSRVVKTAGQTAASLIGTSYLLSDVDWNFLGLAVAGASLTTLLRTFMSLLPETASVPVAEDIPSKEEVLEDLRPIIGDNKK